MNSKEQMTMTINKDNELAKTKEIAWVKGEIEYANKHGMWEKLESLKQYLEFLMREDTNETKS
jgi:hypothetical protein